MKGGSKERRGAVRGEGGVKWEGVVVGCCNLSRYSEREGGGLR